VYDVRDWAEVHRLFYRECWAKTAIADKLGVSRNTVDRLLSLDQPPRYERHKKPSMLDAFEEPMAAMVAEDPKVAATVVRERLQGPGLHGRHHHRKGPLGAAAAGVLGCPQLTTHKLPAGRAGPARLVAHRRPGAGRQRGRATSLRLGGHPPALGRSCHLFHLRAHDA
jgi:hypothetical protein